MPETDLIPTPRALLKSLVYDESCWFDHNGGCQSHGYLDLEPGEICPQRQLKDLLARHEEAAR